MTHPGYWTPAISSPSPCSARDDSCPPSRVGRRIEHRNSSASKRQNVKSALLTARIRCGYPLDLNAVLGIIHGATAASVGVSLSTNLCEEGSLFAGMTERIDLPSDPRSSAFAESVVQEPVNIDTFSTRNHAKPFTFILTSKLNEENSFLKMKTSPYGCCHGNANLLKTCLTVISTWNV